MFSTGRGPRIVEKGGKDCFLLEQRVPETLFLWLWSITRALGSPTKCRVCSQAVKSCSWEASEGLEKDREAANVGGALVEAQCMGAGAVVPGWWFCTSQGAGQNSPAKLENPMAAPALDGRRWTLHNLLICDRAMSHSAPEHIPSALSAVCLY